MATPQLTPIQQDAVRVLVSLQVPEKEAIDLVTRSPGADAGEIASNAIRLRKGVGPRAPVPPPQGAKLQAVGGTPVAPIAQGQAQQEIPGFGPPGGQAAAPTAQQLQAAIPLAQRLMPPSPTGLEPMQFQHLPTREQFAAAGAQPGEIAARQAQPNWFWRLMGAAGPPPAPIAQRPPTGVARQPTAQAPTPTPGPQAIPGPSAVAQPMPAPIKPRVRVRAGGGKVAEAPTKEAKPEAELPLVGTQEQYDKLPIGTRFKHPDGFIYRKERESGTQGPPQKLQHGGVVQQGQQQQPTQPWEATWEATYGMPQEDQTASQDTDTVPAELTPGEYVVPKAAVDKIGADKLDAVTAAAQGKEPPKAAATAEPQAEQTPVGVTGKVAEIGGNPVLRALAYGPKSEGATAADMRQIKGSFVDRLQPGDLAISPNLLKLYPPLSHVNVVDSKGNIVLANARIADKSYYSKDNPTENTFEIWNGPSLGRGYHLVPI